MKTCSVLPLIKLVFHTKSKFSAIFFLLGFPFLDTNDSRDGREGRGHSVTFSNIQTFICNFESEVTNILNRIASNYQTAAQLHKRCYFLSTQTLLTLFQIFLLISLPDRITEETCPLSGIKVNHEII